MAKNAATHPSPASSPANRPADAGPALAPVIEINVRHVGRTPQPEKLTGSEAPEGWIKKVDRLREGKVWIGFFHLYVRDPSGRPVRKKKEKTLGPATTSGDTSKPEMRPERRPSGRNGGAVPVAPKRASILVENAVNLRGLGTESPTKESLLPIWFCVREVRQEIRSIGAMASACAWCSLASNTAAVPPSRSCRKARCNSMRFICCSRWFAFDEIAVPRELADQRIDLAQTQRQLGMALQIAPHKMVIGADADFQGGGASVLDRRAAILLHQRQYAQDAAHCGFAVLLMHAAAERRDLRAGFVGARQ